MLSLVHTCYYSIYCHLQSSLGYDTESWAISYRSTLSRKDAQLPRLIVVTEFIGIEFFVFGNPNRIAMLSMYELKARGKFISNADRFGDINSHGEPSIALCILQRRNKFDFCFLVFPSR